MSTRVPAQREPEEDTHRYKVGQNHPARTAQLKSEFDEVAAVTKKYRLELQTNVFKERLSLWMKRKLVNNETTKNNKIMEQETVNARSDKDSAP